MSEPIFVNPREITNKALFISIHEHLKLITDLALQLEEYKKRIEVLETVCFTPAVLPTDHELFYEKVYIKNPLAYPFHEAPALAISSTAVEAPASKSSAEIA